MPEPVNLADAHATEDPTGYSITHAVDGDVVVGLVLTRLADGEELGVYTSRADLDAAVAADPLGPGGAGSL